MQESSKRTTRTKLLVLLATVGVVIIGGAVIYTISGCGKSKTPLLKPTGRRRLYEQTPVVKDRMYRELGKTIQVESTNDSQDLTTVHAAAMVSANDYSQLEQLREDERVLVTGGDWQEEYTVVPRASFREIVQRTVNDSDLCFEGLAYDRHEEKVAVASRKASSKDGVPLVYSELVSLTLFNLSHGVTTDILWGCRFPFLERLTMVGCDLKSFSFLRNVAMDRLKKLIVVGAPSLTSIDLPAPDNVALNHLVLVYLAYSSPTVNLDSLKKIIGSEIVILGIDLYLFNRLCEGTVMFSSSDVLTAFTLSNITVDGMETTLKLLETSRGKVPSFFFTTERPILLGVFDLTHSDRDLRKLVVKWVNACHFKCTGAIAYLTRTNQPVYLSSPDPEPELVPLRAVAGLSGFEINMSLSWER